MRPWIQEQPFAVVALNREDIEGDNTSTSQPPTNSNALSQGSNHTPSQLFQQCQFSKREEEVKPAGKQVPFALLLPVIEPQLDKDRAMQLQRLYVRLRSNNINKEEFARHMRSLVGDHMLKMAVYKLQQGQLTSKPSRLPMDNNVQKQRLLEHQSDSHGVQAMHKSSNVNAIKQDRGPFPMQGLGKQHQQQRLPFPQQPFTNYGNTAGSYSSPNMNMASQLFKQQTHDLQMRQGQMRAQDVKDASAAGKPTGNEGREEERDADKDNLNVPLVVGGVLIGAEKPGVVIVENLSARVVIAHGAGSSEPKAGVTKKDFTAGSPGKGKRKLSCRLKSRRAKKRKIKLAAAQAVAGVTRLADNLEVVTVEIRKPDNLPPPVIEDCAKNAKADVKETAENGAGKTSEISVVKDMDKSTEETVKDPEVPLEANVKMPEMPLEKDVVSQSFQQPISTPADIPFEGSSSATRLIFPDICRKFLAEAFTPGEKVYVQGLDTLQLSDNIATAMATLLSHTPELCRRWITDDNRLRDLAAEKDKLEEEMRRATTAARDANVALLDEQKAHADLKAERSALISKLAAERNEHMACIKKMEWIVGCHEGKEQKLADELNVSRKSLEEKEEQLKATADKLKQCEADLLSQRRILPPLEVIRGSAKEEEVAEDDTRGGDHA